jgi:hypothetical protein
MDRGDAIARPAGEFAEQPIYINSHQQSAVGHGLSRPLRQFDSRRTSHSCQSAAPGQHNERNPVLTCG